ncbi:MAG: ACP S-malonyltransferase [Desulfobacterota bacterium]|nr:ACP S-malonyltransferase [Thermodesulfobacteriota bacterium]
MGKTAFCFPGQLQERPWFGEGHPLRRDPSFERLLKRASGFTSFDLLDFSFKGEEAGINLKLQVATYLLSMIHYERLRSQGWVPDLLAEHSMGIYAALAASQAISFEEGLWITESIGRILEREALSQRGAMASIVGLTLEEVEQLHRDLNGWDLWIANYNGSKHFVLSGKEEGVEKAIGLALSRNALSASRLTFTIGLHAPPLSSLREEIHRLLREVEIQAPKIPVLNHFTVEPLKRGEIKDFLAEEIARPVHWERCVRRMIEEGVTRFVEVGQEATLTKLIRWIDRGVEAVSAGDWAKEGARK